MAALPFLTPLRRIATPKGDVMHGLRAGDAGFAGFGEAYLTHIQPGATKGWRRHRRMTLNLICVSGRIRLVARDESDVALDAILSPDDAALYRRATVPPGFWVAFHGAAETDSLMLNVADLAHDPDEADTLPLEALAWPPG